MESAAVAMSPEGTILMEIRKLGDRMNDHDLLIRVDTSQQVMLRELRDLKQTYVEQSELDGVKDRLAKVEDEVKDRLTKVEENIGELKRIAGYGAGILMAFELVLKFLGK